MLSFRQLPRGELNVWGTKSVIFVCLLEFRRRCRCRWVHTCQTNEIPQMVQRNKVCFVIHILTGWSGEEETCGYSWVRGYQVCWDKCGGRKETIKNIAIRLAYSPSERNTTFKEMLHNILMQYILVFLLFWYGFMTTYL